jgi:transcriptional regulator of arginine metabolism
MSTYTRAALTKTARHAKIITLLEQHEVHSQNELAELLADDGVQVNQGTLSRDLVEIGALRIRGSDGHLVYAVPSEGGDRTPHVGEFANFEGRLARLCAGQPRRTPYAAGSGAVFRRSDRSSRLGIDSWHHRR